MAARPGKPSRSTRYFPTVEDTAGIFVPRVPPLDAEYLADLLKSLGIPPANGVHGRLGMILIDRDELGSKGQPNDRHTGSFLVRTSDS